MNDKIAGWFASYIQYDNYDEGAMEYKHVDINLPTGTFIPFSLVEIIDYINSRTQPSVAFSADFYYKDHKIGVHIDKFYKYLVKNIINLLYIHTYNNNNIPHGHKIEKYKIKINKYKDDKELSEFLLRIIDNFSYKALGILFDHSGVREKNKASIKNNKNSLKSIGDVFNLNCPFKIKLDRFNTMPWGLCSSGKKFEFTIILKDDYRLITTSQIFNIIYRKDEYTRKLWHFINKHLIFYSYAAVVKNIILTVSYRVSFVITIDVTVELLTNEIFYSTIGALRAELKHISKVRAEEYRHGELLDLAGRIKLDVSSIEDYDLCQYLSDYICTLSLEDFN